MHITHTIYSNNALLEWNVLLYWREYMNAIAPQEPGSKLKGPVGTEVRQWIAASNGVKKLGPKEGRTKQVGDVRLTWKATGQDHSCPRSVLKKN
jgi:hypothetical protein